MGQPISIDDFPDNWELKLISLEEKIRYAFLYIIVFSILIYIYF